MGNLSSLIFYITFFIISWLFYCLYNKYNKKVFIFLSLLIPITIGGFRYMVGSDFNTYIGLYNTYKNSINIINDSRIIELNFIIISKISKFINGERSMFFIYTLLTVLFSYKGINLLEKKYQSTAWLIYLFLYFTLSFNGIRQMLAVSIFLYAIKYICNKNIYKWTIFIVIAGLTHTTAFLLFPLYFILGNNKKLVKWFSIILMIIIIINYQYFINLIGNIEGFNKYAKYVTYSANFNFNNYNFYLSLIILLYFIINYKIIIKDNNNYNYLFLFIIGCVFNYLGFFSPDIKRISIYFKIFEVHLLAQIPFFANKNKNKLLNIFLIIVYSVGSFVIYSYILRQSNIIPYRWW